MSPKSAQRFWGNDMQKQVHVAKSADSFWGNDMLKHVHVAQKC
jgi:hypothetical protein